jgi:hypothetical protein
VCGGGLEDHKPTTNIFASCHLGLPREGEGAAGGRRTPSLRFSRWNECLVGTSLGFGQKKTNDSRQAMQCHTNTQKYKMNSTKQEQLNCQCHLFFFFQGPPKNISSIFGLGAFLAQIRVS